MMDTIVANSPELYTGQFLLHQLEKNWKSYLKELKHCRIEFSNETVHDLRAATRRIMTIVQLLYAISPRPRLQKIIRTFENQLDELDDWRDTQVILAEISETILELPELNSFQKQQKLVEEKILRVLRKKVKKFNVAELSKRIRRVHHFVETEMEDDNLESQLMQAVDDAYLATKQRLGWVDPGRPVTIQWVGMAFKLFRYMAEMVHPLIRGYPNENLKLMYQYQSLISEIQDADVFMQTLADFFENRSSSDLETIRCYYDRYHAEAVAAYTKEMESVHLFWRPAPTQPFPWGNAGSA